MLIKRSRKEKQRADNPLLYAAMAEWFKAVDLKSIDGKYIREFESCLPRHYQKLNRGIKMKTTKKDWIYRVILLILLAIIWDIGAALTSPIFVPRKALCFENSSC